MTVTRLRRRAAQGRAARPPRRLGVAADRRRARRASPRRRAVGPRGAAPASTTFRDFAHFIEVYLAVVDLVRTPRTSGLLTYEVARDMAGQQNCGTPSSPARRTPTCCRRGAASRSRPSPRRSRTPGSPPSATSGWCCAGSTTSRASPGSGRRRDPRLPLDHAPRRAGRASGSAARRSGVPRPQFQPHFDAARAAGLHSVPHAGETTGPETVWDAATAAGCRADRPRHQRRAGPRAARPPRRGTASRSRSARPRTSPPAP